MISASPRLVSQVDLVPSISLLMGVPIPFSSVGGIIPELFISDATVETSRSLSNDPDSLSHELLAAWHVNAWQVMTYFRSYFTSQSTVTNTTAATRDLDASVDVSSISSLEELYADAAKLHSRFALSQLYQRHYNFDKNSSDSANLDTFLDSINSGITSTGNSNSSRKIKCNSELFPANSSKVTAREVYAAYDRFHSASLEFARQFWTQFNLIYMTVGCCLLVVATILMLPIRNPILNNVMRRKDYSHDMKCVAVGQATGSYYLPTSTMYSYFKSLGCSCYCESLNKKRWFHVILAPYFLLNLHELPLRLYDDWMMIIIPF